MSLRKLQMAYLPLLLEENQNNCIYCWKTNCECPKHDLNNDPFLNMNEELTIA